LSTIKKLRTEKKLTQQQAAETLSISLRSYKSYENDTLILPLKNDGEGLCT
jgi:DNA-binding XRE family transcriptional regulator